MSCKYRSQFPASFLSACRKFSGESMRVITGATGGKHFCGPGSGHWPLRADRKEMVMVSDWSAHDTIVTPPQ